MSWVTENKFLTGFSAAMLVGVGALGWLTYSAMDKYDASTSAFDTASAELKRLQNLKPSLSDAHLKELLTQKQQLTDKIGAFQMELKSRVLPTESGIAPGQFQDKLKNTVAQINAKAAEAKVDRPKDFYLGFPEYQSKPPEAKATPALARQLHSLELVMDVLIKTGNIELEEFHRDPLPEEGRVKNDDTPTLGNKKKSSGGKSEHGVVERTGLRIKFASSDGDLRKVLTGLANHDKQLFIVRNLVLQNKQMESPQRVAAAPAFAPVIAPPTVGDTPTTTEAAITAGTGAPIESVPTNPSTMPVPPVPANTLPNPPIVADAPLSYVFGTEKIVSTIEIEVLNIEDPKSKPEKGDKKKDKEK